MASILVNKVDVEENVRSIDGLSDLADISVDDLPGEERNDIIQLAEIIKQHGLLQPITVKTKKDGRYRLVTGWRRLMAHRYLKKSHIAALVLKGKKEDEPLIQLIENVQRKGLNPIDIAHSLDSIRTIRGIKKQESLAKVIGKSTAWVSQHLCLLKTDPAVQSAISSGEIGVGGGREIASLPKGQQKDALEAARSEAQAAGDKKIKTKGARRQARRRKQENAGNQLVIRPLEERESEQREELISSFFADEYGQQKVPSSHKEVVEKFWKYLHGKQRIYIKA